MPYASYKKVNPSSQVIIDGQCLTGCLSNSISFSFKIYYTYETNITKLSYAWSSLKNFDNLVSGKYGDK